MPTRTRAPARAASARELAARYRIQIVWQEPCFEALLLRHLPGCTSRKPPDTPEALRLLAREWPGYRKPLSRVALATRIDREAVGRAASVEPGLCALLRCLGIG